MNLSIDFMSFTLTRNNGPFVAAIFDSFARMERENNLACTRLGIDNFVSQLAVSFDSWLSGTLFLSCQIAELLDKVIDFDAYANTDDAGVFTYEFLEYAEHKGRFNRGPKKPACHSLPTYLFNTLTEDDWVQVCEDFEKMAPSRLESLIRTWADLRQLPVFPTTED